MISAVNESKSSGRHIFEGAVHIALRLRVAKDPTGGILFQVPPEEIDLEPDTIDPVAVKGHEIFPSEGTTDDSDAPAPPAADVSADAAIAESPGAGEAPRPND
jgi:hypothetical protein